MDTTKDIIVFTEHENKKKCSIHPLSKRGDLEFINCIRIEEGHITIPDCYLFLHVEGKPLGKEDFNRPLLLLDASWRRAIKLAQLPAIDALEKRSIGDFITSYPRVSKLYSMPGAGLASVEALYAARLIQGREDTSLLDYYYWKNPFLEINQALICAWQNVWKESKK